MKILLHKSIFLTLVMFLFVIVSFAQSVGDYRSAGDGNWTTLSSWQYFNGSVWSTPSGTSPQGYPGQYIGTGIVVIRDTHSITISSSPLNSFTSFVIGEGNSGILVVAADVNLFNTASVTINPGAILTFNKNINITFPANASLVIKSPGKLDTSKNCTNNNAIYIGTIKFAVCNGGGNADFTFDDLNQNGGSITAIPTTNSPVCLSNSVDLFGNFSGVIGKKTSGGTSGVNYLWTIVSGPSATILNTTSQNANISNASAGTYVIQLTCSTYYGSDLFTNSKKIFVIVNSLPIISTQPKDQLDCEGAYVSFSVVASGASTYTWQYKLPGGSFFAIPISSNVTYPSIGKITLANVGSAQFPNGTQYQVIVSNSSGCSVTSSAATLSVNEITGISPIVTSVTQCYGTNYSYTVATSTPSPGYVVSYQWKRSVVSGTWTNVPLTGDPHFSGANTATLNIINGTPAESAEYRVYIKFSASGTDCSVDSSSRTRKITFLPELTSPIFTITQPDCITPTGSVTLSGLPPIGTWTLNRSGTSSATTTGSGTSTTIIGLAPGIYTYTVILGTCTSVPTVNIIIQPATTAIWNGSWTNGPPTINQPLEFTGNYTTVGDLTACSCTVTNGAEVVVNSGHTLTISNRVNVDSGSLTFENNSSLVQINDAAVNSGNINYKRNTNKVKRYDFTYWSSPVQPQTMHDLSPLTLSDKYYSFNSGSNSWVPSYGGVLSMQPGNGYIIRAPQTFSITVATVDTAPMFVGIPNNGVVPFTLLADQLYLLGNPYPSALDADKFLEDNAIALDGTLYFWTHNSPPSNAVVGNATYNYTVNDYATYNRTGGLSTTAVVDGDPNDPNNNNNLAMPLGKIAAGQGFFAPASATGGSLVFKNSMRVVGGALGINNSQFFRTKANSKTKAVVEKNRVWLNLSNTQGAFKQTLVGYIAGATNRYDNGFDGVSFDGNEFVDFYSVNQDGKFAIQGRALPFDQTDTVPLGYKSALVGDFNISIGKADGLLASNDIYLEDKLLNLVHNLKTGAYRFATQKGTFNDRFVLRYTDRTLGVKEMDSKAGIIAFFSTNKKSLIIRNILKDVTVHAVVLYNLLGQKIESWDVKGREQTNIEVPIKALSSEIYIVKIKTTKGEFSKKIIFNE